MRLFIIGNGFDRAHDLPTSYWDFRTHLETHHPDFLKAFEQHYHIVPNDSEEYKKALLWNAFETNLANIDEDIIIENALGMEMGLESGDVGIEDTLRLYFRSEYQYINELEVYLKEWVKTITLGAICPISTQIKKNSSDIFITFNYTSVLEEVYQIDAGKVLHIHGSLRTNDDDPILGHGNRNRIANIKAKRNDAVIWSEEKLASICGVIEEYYNSTFKNVANYMHKLNSLYKYRPQEIIVIGHSVAGVDLPYYKKIDDLTNQTALWTVYYFDKTQKDSMQQALIEQGISHKRINMVECAEFYDCKHQ